MRIVLPVVVSALSVASALPLVTVFVDDDRRTSTVQTQLGPVRGACATSTCRWLNIPFSEPFARFERSVPRISSYGSGVGSGLDYGPACLQFIPESISGVLVGPQAEDCLNLDIYAPAKSSLDAPLPVMVFVPGGGFLVGSSGQDAGKLPGKSHGLTYDGARLASHDVVVVVIQYRLGIFGFLQQPDGTGGANGFGDQITALHWVKRHVSAFSGNPSAVTVFGESAGSTSVTLLTHLPMASGLFQRAIPESGVCYNSGDVLMSKSEAKDAREDFLSKARVTQEDLLTMDASELTSLTMRTYDPKSEFTPLFVSGVGQPSIDGDIWPDTATQLTPLPVDLLHGFNSGEMNMCPAGGIPTGALNFFTKYLGTAAEGILAQYGEQVKDVDLIADACLRCQSVRYSQRVAARTASQVHFYIYDHPHNSSTHGAELAAVFGTGHKVSMEGTILTTPEALVRRTQKLWTDFAKGRNLSEVAAWPQVQAGSSTTKAMLMGADMSVVDISTARCAAWEAAEAAVGGLVTARMCNDVMVSLAV